MKPRTIIIGFLVVLFFWQGTVYGKEEADILIQSGHTQKVYAVAFTPDGTQVLSGSRDRTLRLWDRATGELVHTLEGHPSSLRSVAFSPDGSQVISGDYRSNLRLWDRATGQLVRTFNSHLRGILAVAFSPDGTQVLTTGEDHTLRLWDRATWQVVRSFPSDSIRTVQAFIPTGTTMPAADSSRPVRTNHSVLSLCQDRREASRGKFNRLPRTTARLTPSALDG